MSDIYWQPGVTLEMVEKMVIKKALVFFDGNKTRTANALDIAVRTLDNKLAKYEKESLVENSSSETNKGR